MIFFDTLQRIWWTVMEMCCGSHLPISMVPITQRDLVARPLMWFLLGVWRNESYSIAFLCRGMCDLNNAELGMPWIPLMTLALDRTRQDLEIGCGSLGRSDCLWQPPKPSSCLILEPGMPQTGRHLPKSSRKEGTGNSHAG